MFKKKFARPDTYPELRVHFGKVEAESDPLLEKDFVNQEKIQEFILEDYSILLGPRGAGKSAIYRIILNIDNYKNKENYGRYKNHLNGFLLFELSRTLVLEEYNFLTESSSAETPDQYMMFWLTYVSLEISKILYVRGSFYTNDEKKQFEDLLRPLLVNFDDPGIIDKTVFEMFKSTFGIPSFEYMGAKLKFGENNETKSGSVSISALLKFVHDILKREKIKAAAFVDRVDMHFKFNVNKQRDLVRGLFLAHSELSTQYPLLKLVIFLRTDIYEYLDLKEADKVEPELLELEWKTESIYYFMVQRLLFNKEFSKYFEFEGSGPFSPAQQNEALKFFFPKNLSHKELVKGRLKRSKNKQSFKKWFKSHFSDATGHINPRMVVRFLISLVKIQKKENATKNPSINNWENNPIFSEKTLNLAYEKISKDSLTYVLKDYDYDGVKLLIKSLRAAGARNFLHERVCDILVKKDDDEDEAIKICNILKKIGFVKEVHVKGEGGNISVKYEIPPLYTANWPDLHSKKA